MHIQRITKTSLDSFPLDAAEDHDEEQQQTDVTVQYVDVVNQYIKLQGDSDDSADDSQHEGQNAELVGFFFGETCNDRP